MLQLWSLLNFVLPDIFTNLDSFQQWFNLPGVEDTIDAERTNTIIQSLHAILKPFLLRRLKVDVEANLPPKKEYVLYAPLTSQQRDMYDAIAKQQLRQLLISGKQAEYNKELKLTKAQLEAPRKTRGKKSRKSYVVDGDDDEYFERLENGLPDEEEKTSSSEDHGDDEARQIGLKWTHQNACMSARIQL